MLPGHQTLLDRKIFEFNNIMLPNSRNIKANCLYPVLAHFHSKAFFMVETLCAILLNMFGYPDYSLGVLK